MEPRLDTQRPAGAVPSARRDRATICVALVAAELIGLTAIEATLAPLLRDICVLPPHTALVLSHGWAPAWAGVIVALTGAGFAFPRGRHARWRLLAAAAAVGFLVNAVTALSIALEVRALTGRVHG
jgi:hypothetical protein